MSKKFSTRLLDKVLAERAKAQEASRKKILKSTITELKKYFARTERISVYLFGSLMEKHQFRPDSDIDLAIKGLPVAKYFRTLGELTALLPRQVDLVDLDDQGFKLPRDAQKII